MKNFIKTWWFPITLLLIIIFLAIYFFTTFLVMVGIAILFWTAKYWLKQGKRLIKLFKKS